MEHDSLSFLTLINKVQSHSVGGLRGLKGLCFQDTPTTLLNTTFFLTTSSWNMIIRVSVVLNGTVGDSD